VAVASLVRAYESAGQPDEARRINDLLGGAAIGGAEEREMGAAREDLDAGRYAEAIRRLQPISDGGTWLAPRETSRRRG
jgi:hypothetical protein